MQLAVGHKFPWEHCLYVGLLPLGAMIALSALVVTRRTRRDPFAAPVAATFWLLVLLTLNVKGHSFYLLLARLIPPIAGIRTMTRIIHTLNLLFAVATCSFLLAIARRLRAANRRVTLAVFFAGAYALVGWENRQDFGTTPKSLARERVAMIVAAVVPRAIRQASGAAVLAVMNTDSKDHLFFNLDARLAAQDLGIPTFNGYSRVAPPGYEPLENCDDLVNTLENYRKGNPALSLHDLRRRLMIYPPQLSCEGFWNPAHSHPDHAIPDSAYAATASLECWNCPVAPGQTLLAALSVENLSDVTWPDTQFGFSTRFLTIDGTALSGFDNRVYFKSDFSPGVRRQYLILLTAPLIPGSYVLEADLVHELVTWFSNKGRTRTARLPVVIRGSPGLPEP